MTFILKFILILAVLTKVCVSFLPLQKSLLSNRYTPSNHKSTASRPNLAATIKETTADKYTSVPGLDDASLIRPSITDKARTITHVCTSGTLCTTSVMDDVQGAPFGSYVDYILDENGWPVLLLSEQSLHTVNVRSHSLVSLFCQLPRSQSKQATAALSRVTLMGSVEAVPDDQLSALKLAFSLVHPYAGTYQTNYIHIHIYICHYFSNLSLLIPLSQ